LNEVTGECNKIGLESDGDLYDLLNESKTGSGIEMKITEKYNPKSFEVWVKLKNG
jgi:hypothetical protein